MKIEGYLFVFLAVFLGGCGAVYWFLSEDPTGTTALLFSAGLGIIIASYLLFTGRRMEVRPEDRPDADIAEGAGEIGFFSPHSFWPLGMAIAATLAGLGIVFGYWLTALGGALLIYMIFGLLFEYYREDSSH